MVNLEATLESDYGSELRRSSALYPL